MNTVEQNFEANLSPRCRDSISWDTAHIGGYVKPTQKHVPTDDEARQTITTSDRKELAEFDANALNHRLAGTGICSTM